MQRESHFLAIDIGNSHVRLHIGHFDGKKLDLEEIYQFRNQQVFIQGHLLCDLINIYQGIKNGLSQVGNILKSDISGIGIDSWGVDYVLLDQNDNMLSNTYHHTDHRTDGVFEKIFKIIPKEEIYRLTGIQFINFNTLPQFYADLINRPWILKEAKTMFFIADFFNFLLTGKKYNEFTMASTSQFFNTREMKWEKTILEKLSIPTNILQTIIKPGKVIGNLLPEIKKECNLTDDIPVISVATHDTASAVAALPLEDKNCNVYISLGTWSLLGIELNEPNTSRASLAGNFTNECGAKGEILYHKILPGLWMFNQCVNQWKIKGLWTSYQEADHAAVQEEPWRYFVNPNDKRFISSIDMPSAIRMYQKEKGRTVHQNIAQMIRGIYESLSLNYRYYIEWIERITKKEIKKIYIIGGGSKAQPLCQLTANVTGKEVMVGLPEATVVGNLITQLIAREKINSWEEAKEIIKYSFQFHLYKPQKLSGCEIAYSEYKNLLT